MAVRTQVPIQFGTIVTLVLAVTVLVCIAGLASPAMAGSTDQHCSGPGCAEQLGCGQPEQLQPLSGFFIHFIVLAPAAQHAFVLTETEKRSVGPPPLINARDSFGPRVTRSPPAV